ncbi:MAG: TlpA disulfide reductase family protein, partial [Actinomycetota bacterium]
LESTTAGRRPVWLIVAAAVVVIGAIAVIAFVASGDDNGGESTTAVVSDGAASGDAAADDGAANLDGELVVVGETRPVVIAGDPLPPLEDGAADPAIGASAPVLTGEGFDGTPITIGGPSDGPTMVVYLAHWCPHCNDEIPELIALAERGDIPADLNVVAVSTGVREGEANYPPSEWLVDRAWPWDVMADDPDATAFLVSGGSSFPYVMILDADGNVVARASGSRGADEIKSWIDESLA